MKSWMLVDLTLVVEGIESIVIITIIEIVVAIAEAAAVVGHQI
jgi:hypothetical protein